jgi:hypothetical protein
MPTQSAPVSETSPTSGYPWTGLPSRMILFACKPQSEDTDAIVPCRFSGKSVLARLAAIFTKSS